MGSGDRTYDIAIVGGGITGAGVARDAALRGFSAVLFEKDDFSSGTTSRTSRLIHGGLRYLEGFHFRLVWESLRERDWLFSRLPHLLRPIPILIPVYRDDRRGMVEISIGIRLYDALARRKTTPRYGTVAAEDAAQRAPGLRTEGLAGGAVFYDYQILLPERLVVENLLSAAASGAQVRNYSSVEEIAYAEGAFRLRIRDRLAGSTETFSASVVVNASGPWTDRVRQLAGLRGGLLHPTKGTHIVLPGSLPQALFVASGRDDRMFYILPFSGTLLAGTTDTVYAGDPDAAAPEPEEIAYLLEGMKRVLPGSRIPDSPPLYAYAGIRPLLKGKGDTPSSVSRQHGVFREGPGGRFISVAGGKLTTFRLMAEDTVDAASSALGRRTVCTTRTAPFPGEIGGGPERGEACAQDLSRSFGMPEGLCRHLVSLYGRRASRVLAIASEEPSLARPLTAHSPDIAAQGVLAGLEEWARTPEDALLRRMHAGVTENRGREAAAALAALFDRCRIRSGPPAAGFP